MSDENSAPSNVLENDSLDITRLLRSKTAAAESIELSEEEVSQYLLAHGLSINELRDKLSDANFFVEEKRGNGKKRTFRWQRHVRGARIKVPYTKFMVLEHVIDTPSKWRRLADTFLTDGNVKAAKMSKQQLAEILEPLIIQLDRDLHEKGVHLSILLAQAKSKRVAELQQFETASEAVEADQDSEKPGSDIEPEPELPREEDSASLYKVHEAQIQDPVIGMGLTRSALPSDSDYVPIDSRIDTLRQKLSTRPSAAQYARIINLFLLWMNEQKPDAFQRTGCLECDHQSAFEFVSAAKSGRVGRTGKEPPIGDVLAGRINFKVKPTTTRMSWALSGTFLSALSDLRENQLLLLSKVDPVSLRSSPLLKQWRSNLKREEIDLRAKDASNATSSVALSGSPIAMKLTQSLHMLQEDSFASWRNRFLSLAQCYSISRYAEMVQWMLCHCNLFCFDTDLPSTGKQKINVILVTQRMHKHKTSMEDDLKCLVRHKDWRLCPTGSFAFFMAHRLLLGGERPPDFNDNKWRRLALFRTERSAYQNLSAKSSYVERLALRDECGVGVHRKVNHLDRHVGALIAQSSGMSLESIRQWGLWRRDCMTGHYMKWPSPDSISQMSGFVNAHKYYVARQEASIEKFLDQEPDAVPLFDAFAFLDDSDLVRLIEDQRGMDTLEVRAYDVMRYIKMVFYQDVVYFHDYMPSSRIFTCQVFEANMPAFQKWKAFVKTMSVTNAYLECEQGGAVSVLVDHVDKMERDMQSIAQADERRDGKLDKILYTLNSMNPKPDRQRKRRKVSNGDEDVPQTSLRVMTPLKDLSLDDLWTEWTVGFEADGRSWPPLKKLEADRQNKKCLVYYAEELETLIRRKRQIAEHAERTSLEHLKALQSHLASENGGSCSLYFLWKHIRKQKGSSMP